MLLPKISIITPTHQAGDTIETALQSVSGQTYRNIEHIIIDCASQDETLPVIRRYQTLYPNIRLLTEKDEGIYDAMNKGLDLCTGEWIYFMGADDTFYNENTLTDLWENGLFQEERIIYGNVIIKGDAPWAKNNSIYDGPFTLDKLFRWNICHQSVFYPRSVIRLVGYFETRYKITADWDYNIRCWAKYKFTYTDKIIAFFTTGGKSSEGSDAAFHLDFTDNMIKYFQLDVLDPHLNGAASPFYYVMALHREKEYINNIKNLQVEIERLKQSISDQQTEQERLIANLSAEDESTIANLKSEMNQLVNDLKMKHAHFITRLTEEHDNQKYDELQ